MSGKRRPKGEGSITKMPNGSLKMTITLGVGADGKQKRRSVTAKTKTELMRRVAELRVQAGLSTHTDKLYFKEVVDIFLNTKEDTLTEGTRLNYNFAIKTVFEPLYQYRIDKITPELIDFVIDKITKRDGTKMNPSTIRALKDKLAAVMNFAVARGLLNVSPLKHTKKRQLPVRRVDTLTLPSEDQLKQLLNEAHEYDKKTNKDVIQLYPLFLLAVATGMRIGELLDLDRKDIDLERYTISVHSQLTRFRSGSPLKTATSRRIIYVQPDILMEVLNNIPPSPVSTKLWRQNGVQVKYETAIRSIYRFLKGCDYLPEHFTFHCFRHYHATQLLLKGINPKEVSKRLGHASIKITLDLYAHWMPEMDAQAANSVGTNFIL